MTSRRYLLSDGHRIALGLRASRCDMLAQRPSPKPAGMPAAQRSRPASSVTAPAGVDLRARMTEAWESYHRAATAAKVRAVPSASSRILAAQGPSSATRREASATWSRTFERLGWPS